MTTGALRGADFLCVTKERQTDLNAARHPPRYHAVQRLVDGSLRAHWSRHIHRPTQQFRPHRHVLLLLTGRCSRTQVPALPLVEEIYHHYPAGKLTCLF